LCRPIFYLPYSFLTTELRFMDLQQKFIRNIQQYSFIQPTQKQLIAVSGGVDSVVLTDLMYAAGYDFVIAHCNFQLRGVESERDEHFVTMLGQKYQKRVLVKKFDTEQYAVEKNFSIQVAARQLRYEWFKSVLEIPRPPLYDSTNPSITREETGVQSEPLQYILTAHHANDSIETVLMNFFKGTGITGMHGILPLQGKLFRPLLFATKEEIQEYARLQGLDFVEDSSNLTDKYTRNFFRHRLFPLLKEIYPRVEDNLLKNIGRFTEIESLYYQAVNQHKQKLLEVKGHETHIPVLKLKKTHPLKALVYEIIKDFDFTANQVDEVIALLESESGKYVSSTRFRIIKNRGWLIISPSESIKAANILIEKGDKRVAFEQGELVMEMVSMTESFQIPVKKDTAALDVSTIRFPLLLRPWKQGDYFYPLGMKKKKKLSRFFIDQKLSKSDKEKVWVVETDKKIVWVIGYRIDERFKIGTSTKDVLKLNWLV
jgi:tRNA(Ile)-lysidine synthase